MKTPRLFAVLHLAIASAAFGQGALTPPPGPPAPTMKTLDQVEARIIVNATNTPGDAANTFIISAPGSYYLTGNVTGEANKHGISIQADDVTLDLNGFALIRGAGPDNIYSRGVSTANPLTNVCVLNGSVRGWLDTGVWVGNSVARLEKLQVAGNSIGLFPGNGSMVRDCVASNNGIGFYCADRTQLTHCIATKNGGGIYATAFVTILDCTASRNEGYGILVGGSCTVMRCSVTRSDNDGLFTGPGCNVSECTVSANVGNGITVGMGSTVRNCIAQANANNGILTPEDNCQIVGNTCDGNSQGIAGGGRGRVDGNSCTNNSSYGYASASLLTRNTARGNGANYLGNPGVVDMSAVAAVPAGTSPWTNFIH